MRSLKPLPFTRVRSTPSSRANLRTDGPACACEKPGSLIGGRPVLVSGVGVAPAAAGAGAFAAGAGGGSDGAAGAVGFTAAGAAGALAAAGGGDASAALFFGGSAEAVAGSAVALTVAMRSPGDTVPPLVT